MWGYASVITLLVVGIVLSQAAGPPYKIPGTEAIILGFSDGKVYVADNTEPRNWQDSKLFCESLEMRLASVETPGQKKFFAVNDIPYFQGYYWTAGRDARSPDQFVWDDNSVSLSDNFDSLSYYISARTCVLINSRTGAKTYESTFCENPASVYGDFGALCETELRNFANLFP